MQETDNYQLTNAINREKRLSAIRAEVLTLPSEKALDLILDATFPATLVQSFPEQDLHFLMHQIGEEDFLPVLSLASSQQWEYILDVEVWHDDRLSMVEMTRNIALLYRADPERFVRWAVKEKTELIEYYLSRNIEIRIREHDEDPSDFGDDFSTIDSVFYFRFIKTEESFDDPLSDSAEILMPEGYEESTTPDGEDNMDIENEESCGMSPETTETLITDMLNTLADMDMSVFQGVLLETESVILAETEEEEFRLKNVRLAEKGFLPTHEAVAVYQPLKTDRLKRRPSIFFEKPFLGSDLPLPPRYPSLILKKHSVMNKATIDKPPVSGISSMVNRYSLFVSALELLENDENVALNLQSEFAFLVNSLVSADKERVRSREALEKIVEKGCCYLDLGIAMIHSKLSGREYMLTGDKGLLSDWMDEPPIHSMADLTPEDGVSILRNYAIKDIFRVGSGAGMALKEMVQSWYAQSYIVKQGLSLTFLGERWLGVVGGLLLNRPLFFDNYTTGVLYRPFASLEDIEQTRKILRSIAEMDKMVGLLNPDHSLLSRRFITWKQIFLTLWAMKRMGLDSSSGSYIPLERFKPFFIELLDLKGGESAKCGKIAQAIRNDFFTWLFEENIVQSCGEAGVIKERGGAEAVRLGDGIMGSALSTTTLRMFDELFDELEREYGTISPEDIDPELIYQFIFAEG